MKRNFTSYLMNEARRKFYSDFNAENSSNQRNLFSTTKRLLNVSNFDYVNTSSLTTLESFIPLNESALNKLIGCSSKKSCMFDPMSTPMLISCADVLSPFITKMINLSLNSGEFADD